jgi:hypothetical protein
MRRVHHRSCTIDFLSHALVALFEAVRARVAPDTATMEDMMRL